MKLDFGWLDDGAYHQYCAHCHAETVERVYEFGKTFYFCQTCQQRHERSIVIDPAIKWWVDDNQDYWHESAGVFVRNTKGEFLFFERTIFPFSYTIPAGHVDAGEEPLVSAARELQEEVGITSSRLISITDEDIIGDSCRRGSDAHRWHAYLEILSEPIEVTVAEEGGNPVWLTLEAALQKDLVYPVAHIINTFSRELTQPATTI